MFRLAKTGLSYLTVWMIASVLATLAQNMEVSPQVTEASPMNQESEMPTPVPYRIGPEDVVKVTVLGQGDYKFSEEKAVSLTGKILLSIMQEEFEIADLSIEKATEKLTAILAEDYLNDPRVIIEVTEFRSRKVLLVGEISKPGEVTLQNATMSLKELLIQSGGPTGAMDKTVIVVGENQTDSQDPIVISLDELLLSSKFDGTTVQSGDIIYVIGRDKQLPISDLNNTIYVFGQVEKPGIIPYTRNMTVLRAVINAGNFTKAAAPGRTSVKRYSGEKIQTISVNLDKVMSGGDKSVDIELKPGDVVYVPRAIF